MTLHAREEFIRTRTGALVTTLVQGMTGMSLDQVKTQSSAIVNTAYDLAVKLADVVAPLDNEDPIMEQLEAGHTVAPKTT